LAAAIAELARDPAGGAPSGRRPSTMWGRPSIFECRRRLDRRAARRARSRAFGDDGDPNGGGVRVLVHAPLKSPDHPVASGERTVARLIIAALEQAGYRPETACVANA
jgi:hypothetical protein